MYAFLYVLASTDLLPILLFLDCLYLILNIHNFQMNGSINVAGAVLVLGTMVCEFMIIIFKNILFN